MQDIPLDAKCAPTKRYIDGSCFTIEALQKIATAYNKKIKNKESQINVNASKNELVENITNILQNKCNDQVCWLREKIIIELNDEDILENTFRPAGPEGKYDWLSTIDINDVVTQYHDKYQEFLFLGAVPYDFMDLPVLELHNDNLFETHHKMGKTKLGMVINLDKHNMPGSHWVALYTDLVKKQVYFFDSGGIKPGKLIRRFINKIVKFLFKKENKKQININNIINTIKTKKTIPSQISNIDIKYNYIQHQFQNTECGVYSINFILRLLNGEKFNDIITNVTVDEEMNKNRLIYFRN